MILAMMTSTILGCGGDADVPTAAELYGTWSATADGVLRGFWFAAVDDGSHGELAGIADVYVLTSAGAQVQAGHYSVEERLVTGHGTTDALVTQVLSGGGAGNTYGNAILAWTGTSFTLSSETASAGELVFERQP